VKRSPSGTQPPAEETRLSTVVIIFALAIVLAFAGSLIFGLRRSSPKVEITDEQPAPQQPLVVNDRRAKVEVQNASGKSGLAKFATGKLRDAGFDVVQFGNAGAPSTTSQVIDRVGNHKAATDIATSLGITTVTTSIDSSRFVDATVILGKDWPPKTPKK
jgi:hypothetical protein